MLEVEGQPSGLGWLPDGDLLVVSMKDRRVLRRAADGTVSEYADVSALTTGHLNDMIVDRQGHAYAGNFGFDLMGGGEPATAALVRIDPDGSASVAAEDLWFPNGMVITDDGTLIVAETFAARFTAFTIQPDGDAHRSARLGPGPAGARARRHGDACSAPSRSGLTAARSTPRSTSGRPTRSPACSAASRPAARSSKRSPTPDGLGVFACGLGGEDRRTLIACAAPDFHEEARRRRARRCCSRPRSRFRARAFRDLSARGGRSC